MRYYINQKEVSVEDYNEFIRVTEDTVAFIEEMEEIEPLEGQLTLF